MSKGIHDEALNYALTYGHEMQIRIHGEDTEDAQKYIPLGKGLMIDLVNEAGVNVIPHLERKHHLIDGTLIICRVSYGVQRIDIYTSGVEEEKFFALYAFKPKGGYPQAIIAETPVTEENPSGIYLYFNEDIQAGPANSQDNTIYTEDRDKSEQHNNATNRDVLFSLEVADTSCVYNEGILFHKQSLTFPGRFNPYGCVRNCFYGANCEKVYAGGHLLFSMARDFNYENRPTLTYKASIIGAAEVLGVFVLVYVSSGTLNILAHKAIELSYSGKFDEDTKEPLIHFSECENIYSERVMASGDPTSMCTFTSDGEEAFFFKFDENTSSSSSDYKKVLMEKFSLKFEKDINSGLLDVKVTPSESKIASDHAYEEVPATSWRESDHGTASKVCSDSGGYVRVNYDGKHPDSRPVGNKWDNCACRYFGDFGASGVCAHDPIYYGLGPGVCHDPSVPRDQWVYYSYQLYHYSLWVRYSTSSWGGTPHTETETTEQEPMMFLVGIDGIENEEVMATVDLDIDSKDEATMSSGTSNGMNVTEDIYPNFWPVVCAETAAGLKNEAQTMGANQPTVATTSFKANSTKNYVFPWTTLTGMGKTDESERITTYPAGPKTLFYTTQESICSCVARVESTPINTPGKPREEEIVKDYESDRYIIAEGTSRYGVACALHIKSQSHGGTGQINKDYMITSENGEHNIDMLGGSSDSGGSGGAGAGSSTVTFPYRRLIDFSPHPKGYALMSLSNEAIVQEREDNKYDAIILLYNRETGEDVNILEKYNELLAETIATKELPPVEPFAAGVTEVGYGTGVSTMFESFGVLSRVPEPNIWPKIER